MSKLKPQLLHQYDNVIVTNVKMSYPDIWVKVLLRFNFNSYLFTQYEITNYDNDRKVTANSY